MIFYFKSRVCWVAVVLLLAGGVASRGAVNLVEDFYLPMKEADLLQACKTINQTNGSAITDTNFVTITSILATGNGTVIYYDNWEDGYETNLVSPTQPTTQVWGDGNDANGVCPGFAHDPVGIPAGTLITISNSVPCSPRNPSQILFDAGDHLAANKALVVTRAGWPSPNTGPVMGEAAVVLSTLDYGTNFISPIGEDLPDYCVSYVGFMVMASQDGTLVTIDLDGAGPTPPFTVTLNRGQSYFVNGGVKRGGTITTSKPAEADLFCGDRHQANTFDVFTLYPQSEWSSSYFTPVPSWRVGANTYTTINYFYNANPNPITILYTNVTGSGNFSIPAYGGAEYPMPTNSGASFASAAGEGFTVVTTCAANATNTPHGSLDPTYNWGYTPLPVGSLTTEADVGWAPGSSDLTTNVSPVWVTPLSRTTVYVVYPGTNNPLTDAFGRAYHNTYVLTNFQSIGIYVTNYPGHTNDQSGMRIYTLDNTLLSVAWGEDPSQAPTGNPGLDLGTSILPFPVPRVSKTAIIFNDVAPPGLSVGDTVQYTVQTDNKGLLPLGNTVIIDLPTTNLQYVTNTTTFDGVSIPDSTNVTNGYFPLDSPGYTIPIILSQGTSVFTYQAKMTSGTSVSNAVNIGGTSIIVSNALPLGYGAASPAVSVYKSVVSPASGTNGVGQVAQFNLQVIDTGNTVLTNLSLVDNFPSNVFQFVSASVPVSVTNAGTLMWTNLGSFQPGQVTNIGVFLLATNASALATNSMTAASVGGSTNTGIATLVVAGLPVPAMSVSKTLLSPVGGVAGIGQTVQYNLQVVDSGATTLSNIFVKDIYPATNFSFVSASIPGYTNGPGVVGFTNIGNFAPGQFTNITVSFLVTNYTATVTNIMIGSSTSGATNGSVLTLSRGGLTITKTVIFPTGGGTVNIGSNVIFQIIIQNTGKIPVHVLPLEDAYSADDFQFVTSTIAPSSIGAGDLYWTNLTSAANLAINASITNNVAMLVTGGATPAVNTAFANYALDTNGAAVAPATGSVGVNTGAAQITGTVYNDINGSGVFTNGDTGLFNVNVTLYANSNGVPGAFVQSITTDANGNYQLLNLSTGAYFVVETILPGYAGTAPVSGQLAISLTSLATNANNNFFQYQIPTATYGTINGTVYNDIPGSGVYQSGDTGVSNITVSLVQDLNSNGLVNAGEPVVQAISTGTNGAYSFPGVAPGYYVVQETVPANYVNSGDTAPPNDAEIGVYVASGAVTNGNNFFLYYVGAQNTNTQPVAVPDFTNTPENVAVVISAVANDIATGGFALTITNASATNGVAVIQNGTNILFTPTADFTGTATIGYTETNGNGGKATSLITITVTPVADIQISKSAASSVYAGTNFNYTLTVTNAGPGLASNVVASDVLPTNVVFVSASGNGTNSSGTVTWSLGNLAANATSNLTVTVTAPASGTITNTATVSSPTSDPDPTNNTSPPVGTTVMPVADVSLSKIGPANVFAGTNFSYTITVTNSGPSVAGGVVVTDALPAGAIFLNASGGGNTNSSGVVNWLVGSLAAGQASNLTVTVTAPLSGSLTNVAFVSSPTIDTNLFNNTNTPVVTTVTPIADLAIGKTGPASVFATSNLTYNISVTNLGPSAASLVVVTDSLPAGAIFLNASGGGNTNSSGAVNWSLGTLSSGQTSNLTLVVTSPAGGSLTNVAFVHSPTLDTNIVNNTNPPVVTAVVGVSDVVVLNAGPGSVDAGAVYTNTVTVTNAGPSVATNVVVVDAKPDGTFVTNVIALLPVGVATNFFVGETAPGSGPVTNVATEVSGTFDPALVNNTNIAAVTAVVGVSDVVVLNAGPGSVDAGAVYTNTVTVTNAGPSVATNVVVVDAKPDGTFVTNVIALLPVGVATNFFVGETAPGSGPVTNVATEVSGTFDPALVNNTNIAAVTAVVGVSDVVVLNAGPGSVDAGAVYTNTVTVTNAGPSVATNVVVVDAKPDGTFVTNVIALLPVGVATNFFVGETAPGSGPVTNVATEVSGTFDPALVNNTNIAAVTAVVGVSDVVVLNAGPGSVDAGAVYTNTVTVTNAGPSVATNVVVVDAKPDGTFVTNVIALLPVGVATNFFVGETAPGSGPVTNVATEVSGTFDPALVNNTNIAAVTAVVGVSDVVVLNAGPGSVDAGAVYTNTVTVTNAGPSVATNVVVVDAKPDGTFVTNVIALLPVGVATNFFVGETAPGSGPVTNVATEVSGTFDPALVNNTNIAAVTAVVGVSDVVVLNAGPGSVDAGAVYTNTVTVTNAGPSVATNVVVVDAKPDGTFVTNVIALLPVGVATNFFVGETAPGSGPVTNVATEVSGTFDPALVNNTNIAAVTAVVGVSDVVVTVSGPTNVLSGATIIYAVTVTNAGPSMASNVIVGDLLPTNSILASVTDGGTSNSGVVTWPTIPSLTNSGTFTFNVTITAPLNGTLTNTVSGSSSTIDPNPANNNGTSPSAIVITTVTPSADIAVFKTGPATGIAGSNLTYTITVTNNGPAPGTNVVVADQLPAGFTFVSAVPAAVVNSNNVVSWPPFNLATGINTNFMVTAISAEGGNYTNFAFSTSDTADSNPTNNNGTSTNSEVITTVTPVADLAVFKSGTNNVPAGGVVTYTITATNAGPSTATNVVIQDTLPAGVTLFSAPGGSLSGGVVSWSLATLARSNSATFDVTITNVPANGSFTNFASGTSGTPDPDPTNNNGTLPGSKVVTTVVPSADVQVFVSGPTNVTVGDGFSYTITVTNAGPSPAVSTLVTNLLPTNVVFFSASAGGTVSNSLVTWPVIPLLTNGQATNLILTVTPLAGFTTNSSTSSPFSFVETNTTASIGFLTNKAAAFAVTFDPNLTNNSASTSYTNAQVQTVIVPGVFTIFLSTNTYATNVVLTNTIIPIGNNLFIVGTSAWNPVTQLYEETVSVTNNGTQLVHALRVYVGGLRSGVTLYNATGTNNGVPYVEYDPPYSTPLYNSPPYGAPTNSVTFTMEFYVANGRPFTNSLSAVAIPAPVVQPVSGVQVTNVVLHIPDPRNPNDTRLLVQFASIPGRTYTITYSDDLITWYIAVPSIVASSTETLWYDDGPPETLSKPGNSRYYQIILQP